MTNKEKTSYNTLYNAISNKINRKECFNCTYYSCEGLCNLFDKAIYRINTGVICEHIRLEECIELFGDENE